MIADAEKPSLLSKYTSAPQHSFTPRDISDRLLVLTVVQELLCNSVDHLLYVENWKPTTDDVLKSALDVAKGAIFY